MVPSKSTYGIEIRTKIDMFDLSIEHEHVFSIVTITDLHSEISVWIWICCKFLMRFTPKNIFVGCLSTMLHQDWPSSITIQYMTGNSKIRERTYKSEWDIEVDNKNGRHRWIRIKSVTSIWWFSIFMKNLEIHSLPSQPQPLKAEVGMVTNLVFFL